MLDKQLDGKFVVTMELDPGTYEYKFIVDGVWRIDGQQPFGDDGQGNTNNIIDVGATNSMTIK